MEKKQTLSSIVKETILMLQVFLTIFIISLTVIIFTNNSENYSLGYKIQEKHETEKNLLKIKEEIQNQILTNSSIKTLNTKLKVAKMTDNFQIEFIDGRYSKLSQK